jgi:hypothetical protein
MIVDGVAERNSSSGIGEGDFAAAAATARRVDFVDAGVKRAGFLVVGEPSVDTREAARVDVRVRVAAAALAATGGDEGGAAAVEERVRVVFVSAVATAFFVAAAAGFVDVSDSAATGAAFLGRKGRGIAALSSVLLAFFTRGCFD